MPSVVVRPALLTDVLALGRLAGQLVAYHHQLDPLRFMTMPNVEEGYGRFLGSQIDNPKALVLAAVAEDGAVVGYAYATLEGRDFNALLEAHGALQDVLVDPAVRRRGIGRQLVQEVCDRLRALGAPRVVLSTATENVHAQAMFSQLGFRKTMIEMTREST
jgi:ribosomal protein S18 acetylase RimI-like enzyme